MATAVCGTGITRHIVATGAKRLCAIIPLIVTVIQLKNLTWKSLTDPDRRASGMAFFEFLGAQTERWSSIRAWTWNLLLYFG